MSLPRCSARLTCGTCPENGNTRPRCTCIQPTIPTSKVKGMPFNKYSWLTTHNSFAWTGSTFSEICAVRSVKLCQNLQEDRKFLERQVKSLHQVVNWMKMEKNSKSAKAELVMGLKERDAFIYKHRYDKADDELSYLREWFVEDFKKQ